MAESLTSVGLDVGTTTTQLIVSRLGVENRASGFAVPDMAISRREILYESPVYFTPLIRGELVDGEGIRRIVAAEYEKAGMRRQDVDTGAIIITGETSRKENAAAVLESLADFAGDFVVATAGPDLESVLSAKGAGAAQYSEQTGKTVLHMDIGGGTSNLSLIENGAITATACLNVGGRLLKFDEGGTVTYVSPVLAGLTEIKVGQKATEEAVEAVAVMLTHALEMAAGLRERTALLKKLMTAGSTPLWASAPADPVISFSGGVADCIASDKPWHSFGDMGPVLGRVIRQSRLCAREFVLGRQTIRATVIGAGCHSAQLSGSTVFCRNVKFPIKNLPVAWVEVPREQAIRAALARQEGQCIVAFPGVNAPSYGQVAAWAEEIAKGVSDKPVYIAMEADMAKALGQALALRLPEREILSIDRLRLREGDYLDVGAPVGPALPVVIKTLILER